MLSRVAQKYVTVFMKRSTKLAHEPYAHFADANEALAVLSGYLRTVLDKLGCHATLT
jgi:hypothetical protein